MSTAAWKNAVSGTWSTAADWLPATVPDSSAAEVTIAAPGTYVVTIGTTQDFTAGTVSIGSAATLDLFGTLLLSQLSGAVVIGHGGVLETGGEVAGGIVNDGLIDAARNTFLGAEPTGTGNLALGSGATLEIGVGDSERVVFTGTDATLLLAAPGQFTGTISGYEQTDTIALAGLQASGVSVDGDALEVLSGNTTIDTLNLPASYATAQFSVVESNDTALISETGITYAVEGETWGTSTITWSFAATNYPEDSSDTFTDAITQSADQAIIATAMQAWSSVTGLTFVEIPDSPTPSGAADIRIGWGSFSTGGEIGETDFSDQGSTLLPDVLIRLEDPALDPLDTSSGTAIYTGTDTSLMQVALHELGHSIGLNHTPDPNAIMNPTAGPDNRQLDASDLAGGQALYAGDIPCYAAGTRILTEAGEIPIERLKPGDLLRSALTGLLVPVVWTGHRTLRPVPPDARPIRVRAHAFGDGAPTRDLVLSPDHAIRCGDLLIPVRHLVDATAITRIEMTAVTWWHVELPAHDVIFADGLAAETYLDTGNRGAFGDTAGTTVPHAEPCLRLCVTGAAVSRARRHLAERARRLGWRTDPVTVRADGRALRPARSGPVLHQFLVPAGVRDLALIADHLTACLLDGTPTDRRTWRLGGAGAVLEVRLVRGRIGQGPHREEVFFEKKNQKTF